ncbi:hypothetical protein E6H16_07315, partial [Candidatus Bathyarchaeota archaeon]
FSSNSIYSTDTLTYNWLNEKSSETDPVGNTYTYSYGPTGRLTSVNKPDGNHTLVYYNDLNSIVRSVDENVINTCRTYDRLGRLLTVIENGDGSCLSGTITNYYYDEAGRLTRVVDAKLQSTMHTYDNLGRLTSTTNPDQTSQNFVYDNDGNLVQSLDGKQIASVYTYDSLNRLSKMTYCGTPTTTDAYLYDKNGNVIQYQNLNATIGYNYDSRNRVLVESYGVNTGIYPSNLTCPPAGGGGGGGGGGSVASGTLIRMADGSQIPVQLVNVGDTVRTYDVSNGVVGVATISDAKIVTVDNSLVLHTTAPLPFRTDYNPRFRLHVLVNGTVILKPVTRIRTGDLLYNYDESKWVPVTKVDLEFGGNHTVYDLTTNPVTDFIANGYADCPKICPNSPSGNFAPPAGPSNGSTPNGDPTYVASYYYQGEVLSRINYPNNLGVNFAANYTYDDMGRILKVYNPSISNPQYLATFTYDKDNRISTVTYGNGLLTSYGYDTLSRPNQIKTVNSGNKNALLLLLNYAYSKTGLVTGIVGNSTNTSGSIFTINEQDNYDALRRLTIASDISGTTTTNISYAYDANGNRLTQNVNNIPTTYTYTNGNLLNSSYTYTSPSTSVRYTNDANDNPQYKYVTVSGTTTTTAYSFGVLNRLYSVSVGSSQAGRYGYDGLNRRVVSVENIATTYYAYLGTNVLYSFTGSIPTDYVFANGLLIAKVVSGGSPNYYHSDIIGSTRLVTDSANSVNVLFSNGYQPFGQDNGRASGSETYKFTGKPYSSTNGLYYEFQRWYDNATGRFISQDPLPGHLRNPQSLDAFSYVLNQPTRLVDPSGMDWVGDSPCGGDRCAAPNPLPSNDVKVNDVPTIDVTSSEVSTNTLTPQESVPPSSTEEISNIGKFLQSVELSPASDSQGNSWQLGDPVTSPTKRGNYPSWTTVRNRMWKTLALTNSAEFESINTENTARMQMGRAALDETGRPFEIHHINGRDIVDPHNIENLEVLRWWQHFKTHYGWDPS